MDQKTKEFLINKLLQTPEFLGTRFIPALERLEERVHLELHHANRKENIEGIKYAQGKYDGVQEILNLIAGLQIAETKKAPILLGLKQVFFGSGGNNE